MSSNRARNDNHDDVRVRHIDELKYQGRRRQRRQPQRSDQVKTESMALQFRLFFPFFIVFFFVFSFSLFICLLFCIGASLRSYCIHDTIEQYTSPRAHLYVDTTHERIYSSDSLFHMCVWTSRLKSFLFSVARHLGASQFTLCVVQCVRCFIYLTQSRWRELARALHSPAHTSWLHTSHCFMFLSLSNACIWNDLCSRRVHVCARCAVCMPCRFHNHTFDCMWFLRFGSAYTLVPVVVFVSFVHKCISTRSTGPCVCVLCLTHDCMSPQEPAFSREIVIIADMCVCVNAFCFSSHMFRGV